MKALIDGTRTPVKQSDARKGTQITLSNITKDYGLAKPAVDDISLTIQPGEFMTLLGPSGSGKTTTLNMIAGFETLSGGTISLDSRDVGQLPPHKRNLGMLFQNYALFPHMTVAQNIGYPLRERKVPKTEIAQRVSAVLELVQLTGRDTNYPAQLSGGQQQRVALARAIVFNPSALLLDEPLGALDRNLRATLQLEIRRIHRELGATFVFVTHDQEEAMNLSDRIALFKDGHIEQVGSPLDLYNAPRTLFAATFIGDSTVLRLPSFPGLTELAWEGHSLRGFPGTISESVKTGAPAAVIVRPESLSVARAGESVPVDANTVTGSVRDVEFMGGYRTVILSLANGAASGRARIAAADTRFAVGDPVTAWWMPVEQRIVAV